MYSSHYENDKKIHKITELKNFLKSCKISNQRVVYVEEGGKTFAWGLNLLQELGRNLPKKLNRPIFLQNYVNSLKSKKSSVMNSPRGKKKGKSKSNSPKRVMASLNDQITQTELHPLGIFFLSKNGIFSIGKKDFSLMGEKSSGDSNIKPYDPSPYSSPPKLKLLD